MINRYGAEGKKLVGGALAFLKGINAAQDDMCPRATCSAPTCPAEYVALQKNPRPWRRADLVYVASLVGGIFGKGGGGEYDNALWLQHLQAKFGDGQGRRIYDDLREKNDLEAPTTLELRTPYGGEASRTGQASRSPTSDGPSPRHRPTGGPTPGPPRADPSLRAWSTDRSGRLNLAGQGMSNAMLGGADHTKTGHPMTVFGPQTSYYTPQLLTEQVLMGPHVRARGVSFAGVTRRPARSRSDYAWSATARPTTTSTPSSSGCATRRTAATVRSTGYRVGAECVPMDRHVHTETVIPNMTAPSPPETHRYLVLRTRHGIVQLRTTVNGRPVAIVLQRSTYGREVDSVAGFARLNNPAGR